MRVLVASLLVCACGRIDFDARTDAAGDTGDAPAGGFHDITDPTLWTTFDLDQVNTLANGFYGATFDGRYVHMIPNDNVVRDGVATHYDTQQPFATPASWQTYDLGTMISPTAKGFNGGVFDGRYVYLAPLDNGLAGPDGVAARYDTQTAFGVATSWTLFDMTTLDAAAKGFYGMAFDGTYVYFVPDGNVAPYDGVVTRYDTRLAFDVAASWAIFDVTTVDPLAKGFWGVAFDGTYIYLVPCFTVAGFGGLVARYDTRAPFATAASWSTFDTAGIDPSAIGFAGAAFDGRFIYFVPINKSVTVRYDTQAAFASASSWVSFDLATVNPAAKGFIGTVFDGRYVYFIPDGGGMSGLVVRLDTLAPFATAGSWSMFDITTIDPRAKGFFGGAFDGRFIYLAPTAGTVAARFDARDPPLLPPRLGSFM